MKGPFIAGDPDIDPFLFIFSQIIMTGLKNIFFPDQFI